MNKFELNVRLLVACLVIVGGTFVSALGVNAQATDSAARDQAAAATALQDYFALAAGRDFNALYDGMHPDSKAMVPRAVALNLFNDIYSSALASEAIITSIELGEWTWPVNGNTYPDSATFTFLIPVVDADGKTTWIEDTWYMVRTQGQWLWFLGSSTEFINQINQQYADSGETVQTAPTGGLQTVAREDFIETVANDLDSYYREVVGYTEYDYESPGVVVVSEGTSQDSACGPAQEGFLGFYCPLDRTLYLEESFLLGLYDDGNDFAAAFVIAHEWAHHVQSGIGFERTGQPFQWNQVHSIELELMADCFSGAWALDSEVRGLLEPGDLEEAENLIFYQLGDPKFVGEFDPQSHGNGEQRIAAFENGYTQGLTGCNLSL